jgi:hypothetical protein
MCLIEDTRVMEIDPGRESSYGDLTACESLSSWHYGQSEEVQRPYISTNLD